MLGTQFSCVATPNTRFQIAIDKYMFHQKANSYQRKELLIEGDDEAPSTKCVKAPPMRMFKHKLEALKKKTKLSSLNLYAMMRFYRLRAH